MSDVDLTTPSASPASEAAAPARKRPKPGERRVQILQALATMLEQPGAERITTAALAARLEVSEAALYRHFASKAQMFEGLIEFIEQTRVHAGEPDHRARDGRRRCRHPPGRQGRPHAAAVCREKSRHDARHGGRRAGVRERAPAAAHEPVFRQDRIDAQAKPARRGRRQRLGHAQCRCAGAGLGAHRLRGGPAAALCALGFQARCPRSTWKPAWR